MVANNFDHILQINLPSIMNMKLVHKKECRNTRHQCYHPLERGLKLSTTRVDNRRGVGRWWQTFSHGRTHSGTGSERLIWLPPSSGVCIREFPDQRFRRLGAGVDSDRNTVCIDTVWRCRYAIIYNLNIISFQLGVVCYCCSSELGISSCVWWEIVGGKLEI